MNTSSKSYTTAVCLSGIFGLLGIHHFYLGRHLHGIFDLGLSIAGFSLLANGQLWGFVFLAIDVIHTIVVTIMLLVGAYKDGDGLIVSYPGQNIE